jgi:hypothetical protein
MRRFRPQTADSRHIRSWSLGKLNCRLLTGDNPALAGKQVPLLHRVVPAWPQKVADSVPMRLAVRLSQNMRKHRSICVE